jgi:hypothetical protein
MPDRGNGAFLTGVQLTLSSAEAANTAAVKEKVSTVKKANIGKAVRIKPVSAGRQGPEALSDS